MALNSFNLYYSYKDAFEMLSDAEVGRLIKGALDYAENQNEPTFKGNERFVWAMIKGQIDRDQQKYIAKCQKNRENVNKRYTDEEDSTNEYDRIRTNTNATKDKDKDRDKDKDKDNTPPVSPSRGKRFVPPTLEEVTAYCKDRNNGVDPEAFIAFYSSKGWKVGNQSMKDWKSAIVTWEKRQRADGKKQTYDELEEQNPNGLFYKALVRTAGGEK